MKVAKRWQPQAEDKSDVQRKSISWDESFSDLLCLANFNYTQWCCELWSPRCTRCMQTSKGDVAHLTRGRLCVCYAPILKESSVCSSLSTTECPQDGLHLDVNSLFFSLWGFIRFHCDSPFHITIMISFPSAGTSAGLKKCVIGIDTFISQE